MSMILRQLLETQLHKETLLHYIQQNPEHFADAFQIALSTNQPSAWRAAWILGHATCKKDARIETYITLITEIILDCPDGHQRELLKLLEKAPSLGELEGKVFDICTIIWENPTKIPSTRMVALRMMGEIARKYPEFERELDFFVQEHYLEGLSPGIQNAIQRMIANRKK